MGKIIGRVAIFSLVFAAGFVTGICSEYNLHKDAIEACDKNETEE